MLNLSEHRDTIKNIYCYIFEHYGSDGLALLIYRNALTDDIVIQCGDWNGNKIDIVDNNSELAQLASDYIRQSMPGLCQLMCSVGIQQAQYFLANCNNELVLVDVQLSLNKFAGPGMLGDIFGKLVRTPEPKKIEVIDDRALEYIDKATGSYEGNLILKPSRYRTYTDATAEFQVSPLYVEVIR